MANPGSCFSAATNDFAASWYSNRCNNNRPRIKSLCAAPEWVEVGNVALPKPGIVCACNNAADVGNNRTKRNVFFMETLAFEQRRFVIVNLHSPRPLAAACGRRKMEKSDAQCAMPGELFVEGKIPVVRRSIHERGVTGAYRRLNLIRPELIPEVRAIRARNH